ncbi:hypothetical protein VNO77_26660 [Canavalia gladiata]|uniref:Uncharacterized protein n=1 Tax=Canavalia gladiata TaxID=3824 RepID=A0AAN9Q5S0_CANGL
MTFGDLGLNLNIKLSLLVHGRWCLVYAWCLVVGAWCMRGAWCLVLGPWFMVHGSWFMIHGSWCMVLGPWFMVHGAWCMVHGPWRPARPIHPAGSPMKRASGGPSFQAHYYIHVGDATQAISRCWVKSPQIRQFQPHRLMIGFSIPARKKYFSGEKDPERGRGFEKLCTEEGFTREDFGIFSFIDSWTLHAFGGPSIQRPRFGNLGEGEIGVIVSSLRTWSPPASRLKVEVVSPQDRKADLDLTIGTDHALTITAAQNDAAARYCSI